MRSSLVAVAVTLAVVVPAAPAAATPTAVFTYKPDVPRVGEPVSLWAGASVCDAWPCRYQWSEIGEDGKESVLGTGRSLVVTFVASGVKTVQLRLTNRGFRAPPGPREDIVRKAVMVFHTGMTTIDAGPSGSVNTSDASFAFSSSTTDKGFACSLDGADRAPCESPVTFSGLADGPHSFAVVAADGAEATRDWTVDTTIAPFAPLWR